MNYLLIITNLVYCIVHSITKEEKSKKLYKVIIIIANVLNIFTNLTDTARFAGVLTVLSSLYILVYSYIDNNKYDLNINYVILLSSIFLPFVATNVLNINQFLAALIFILLMVLAIIFINEETIRKITYIYTILPLFIIKFFVKEKENINVVTIIGTIIGLFPVIFTVDISIGLYIGIIGILLIIIGYRDDAFSPIFKFGIVVTIINIIIQLFDLWSQIPFWLYLLIAGLGLIGFVMYKEIKKSK